MSEPSDFADARARRLLARYLDGDAEAFGELARLHYDRLWAVALRMSGDPEEAADALQEAMVAAMRGAGGFRGDAMVSTWLHRIVVNACLDRHRKRKRQAESAYTDQDWTLPDPQDRISQRELAWEVEQALARLPSEQRAAITLVDVEGWPVSQAAEILGVPAGTVKSRCSRGRAKLASDLAHWRNQPGGTGVQRDTGRSDSDRGGGGEA